MKIVLLDTNAMSFLLKKNDLISPAKKLDKLGWRLCFHPLNDFEFVEHDGDLRKAYLSLIRVEKTKYSYHSKYFVCPKPPPRTDIG